ncbi:MAG: TniQ family protein [Anaerolineaceae bacterium]|nr:TniQ family protein [Anaerolineaceae bacterium]
MMIRLTGKPNQMPDELLFSYVYRLAVNNVLAPKTFIRLYFRTPADQFGNISTIPYGSTTFMHLLADCLQVDPLDLFWNTSIYPGTAPLMSINKQFRVIASALRANSWMYPNLIGKPQSDISLLRYCPECAAEETEEHGFSWLHRSHHMPGVTACCEHGVRLLTVADNPARLPSKLILKKQDPVPAEDIETKFAAFARDFLQAAFDTNSFAIRSMAMRYITPDVITRCGKPDYEFLFGCDSDTFFRNFRKFRAGIDRKNLLTALYAIFDNVRNIPLVQNSPSDEFIKSAEGYQLLSPYRTTCLRMIGNRSSFVTTPSAFIAGWRETEDDLVNEQDQFHRIMNNTMSEYEPLDTVFADGKEIRLLHRNCGKLFNTSLKEIFSGSAECPCLAKRTDNINYLREQVECSGKYQLICKREDGMLEIKSNDCGHIFHVDYANWSREKECRICMTSRHQETLFKFRTDSTGSYDSDTAFKQRVSDLTGNEYTVVGKYINCQTPVGIKHEKCGVITSFIPDSFLRGVRCKCSRYPDGKEFIHYVEARSCGIYAAQPYKSNYLITNTVTGEKNVLSKRHIIQELERPTRSDRLPLTEKGEYVFIQEKSNNDKVIDFLSKHVEPGSLFFKSDIKIPNLTSTQLGHVIGCLKEKGILKSAGGRPVQYIYKGN